MRSRTFLFTFVLLTGSLLLPLAAHAAIPFFGPIIPTAYNRCPASWGLLVTVVNNLISLLITLAIVFIAPLMIAYSGFLFVVNPVNAGGKEQAKGILLNTVVGIVIAMAGWMIVDAVMAVLYNPNASSGTTTLTTWSQLITSGGIPPCIDLAGSLTSVTGQPPATGVTATGSLNTPPSAKQTGGACDPAAVQAAAAAGQPSYTLTTTQANILACIAQPESSCGTNLVNGKWNTGTSASNKASTAVGAFQVLLSSNHSCYENTSCYSAAGVSGPLNCQNAFDSFGNPIPGNALVDQCKKAASSLNCSAAAAACLLANNGGSFSPWQADVKSQQQTGCITSGV